MSQMDIKDLDFQELLPNQGLEILGGAQQLLADKILKEPLVTLEAVSLSSNVFIAREILELDPCDSCMGLGPRGPIPGPGPGIGPIGEEFLTNAI